MGAPYNDIIERMRLYGKLKNDSAVARALGITPQALSNYKKRTEIPLKLVFKFADIYGIRIDWLLTGKGTVHRNEISEKSLKKFEDNFMAKIELEEIIYLGKLLKILRAKDEHTSFAMKHTINTFFQYSELTREIIEIFEKEKNDRIKKEVDEENTSKMNAV